MVNSRSLFYISAKDIDQMQSDQIVDSIIHRKRANDLAGLRYPLVDLDVIIHHTDNLQEIVNRLVERIQKEQNDYFEILKYLVEEGDVSIDDQCFLNDQLEQAVRDDDEQKVQFSVHGDCLYLLCLCSYKLLSHLGSLQAIVSDYLIKVAYSAGSFPPLNSAQNTARQRC